MLPVAAADSFVTSNGGTARITSRKAETVQKDGEDRLRQLSPFVLDKVIALILVYGGSVRRERGNARYSCQIKPDGPCQTKRRVWYYRFRGKVYISGRGGNDMVIDERDWS
jgi:hypothetical protein